MYVSWDEVGFELWEERPDIGDSGTGMGVYLWHGSGAITIGAYEEIPGFPKPDRPTLWEVTADGVKIIEEGMPRVEELREVPVVERLVEKCDTMTTNRQVVAFVGLVLTIAAVTAALVGLYLFFEKVSP